MKEKKQISIAFFFSIWILQNHCDFMLYKYFFVKSFVRHNLYFEFCTRIFLVTYSVCFLVHILYNFHINELNIEVQAVKIKYQLRNFLWKYQTWQWRTFFLWTSFWIFNFLYFFSLETTETTCSRGNFWCFVLYWFWRHIKYFIDVIVYNMFFSLG